MLKVSIVILELLRKALFKDKDEFNLSSSKFDALKVSIFLYIVLSAIFTIYSIKIMGSNILEIRLAKNQIQKYATYKECIDKQISLQLPNLINRIKSCSVT